VLTLINSLITVTPFLLTLPTTGDINLMTVC
jgi:hypothetical protein